MREPDVQIIRASDVRRSLTRPGDIRGEIGFQNDINALLARFDEVRVPWQALFGPTPTLPPSVMADTTPMPSAGPPVAAGSRPARINRIEVTVPRLRVLDGGAGVAAPTLGLLTVGLPQLPRVAATPAPAPATKQPRPTTAAGGTPSRPRRRV